MILYQALEFLIQKISEDCNSYGDKSIQTLPQRYAKERPAESVMSKRFMMPALVISDLLTDWKVFRKYRENKRFNSFTTELSGHQRLSLYCPK